MTRGTRRRIFIFAGTTLLAGTVLAISLYVFLRYRYPFQESALEARGASTVYTDCKGTPILARLGESDTWRLPRPLGAISPRVVQAVIAVEDQRFRSHCGVDPLAVLRAAGSNASAGRIVSGASTISMQLARIAHPEPRSFTGKIRQVFRALDLEAKHDKDWILTQYLNHVPFGANIVGVEAAALRYFGHDASQLSIPEAALLAGLPQRPSALRPDRHPDAARTRRNTVLERMLTLRSITPDQCQRACDSPVRVQRHDDTANRLGIASREPLFCSLTPKSTGRIRTTLDPQLQTHARLALRSAVAHLPHVADGAAVVIGTRTGNVRAFVGTLDFARPLDGQVNAATALRSPGSALKPFIYAVAMDGGLIVPDTRLDDRPLTYRDYRPGNFDGTFVGGITARMALSRSLNTPAVILLQRAGAAHVLKRLHQCGLRSLNRSAQEYGLALALGGGEVTLLELTNAYAGLARGGLFHPWRTCSDQAVPPSVTPFARGTVTLVTDMLATTPLPGAVMLDLAWKTGTSNGCRDAWCFAYNTEYTVGVWLGNKSGAPSGNLVGARAAAPVVADLFLRIYRQQRAPPAQTRQGTVQIKICRRTGLRPTAACKARMDTEAPDQIPLRPCMACTKATAAASDSSARILAPAPGTYHAENGAVTLALASVSGKPLLWYVDDTFIGRFAKRGQVAFTLGIHRIHSVDQTSGATHDVRVAIR